MKAFVNFLRSEEGTTIAEYAFLLGLIVVAIATVIVLFRDQVANQFTASGNAFNP